MGKTMTSFTIPSRLVLFALATSQILLACSNHEVSVKQHEKPVVGDEVVIAPVGPTVDIGALKKTATLSTGDSVTTLQTLEPFVLNRRYLEDPRVVNTKLMRLNIRRFNTALLELQSKNPAAAAPWIEKTRIVIESGCDGHNNGCTNLQFFRANEDSAKIMALAAKSLDSEIDAAPVSSARRDELVRLYYRRLALGLTLTNQVTDASTEFMYLARASDYSDAFSRAPKTSRERELLLQHTEVFEIILNRINPDLSNPVEKTRFEKFVNAFSPWNYSRRAENPFGQAATRMLSLAAGNFLYDSKTGELSESLKAAIQRSEKVEPSNKENPLDSVDDSFTAIASALKTQEPGIWKNLGLSDAIPRNEYFFVIDRIYGNHFTPDDATGIWQGSRRDSTALLNAAQLYIKIQIAAQIVRTNRYMGSIYSNSELSMASLFQKAVEKSYPISTQWNEVLSRINRIQLFLDRNFKASDESYKNRDYVNVDLMLKGIARNIKYLSVYPNMMLMTYFLADARAKLEFETPFGKHEYDSATIITAFFSAEISPLFNFGNDGNTINRIETLYAFLFALKTEAFKTFSVNKNNNLSIPHFFEVVTTKFLEADRINLEEEIESLRSKMRQSSTMVTYLQVCRQDAELIRQGIKPGQKGQTFPMKLDELKLGVYLGSETGLGRPAYDFHGSAVVSSIRDADFALRRKLDFVNNMIGILDKHLEKSGVDVATRLGLTKQIEGYIANIRSLRTEYLTEVTRWHKTFSKCSDQSIKTEIDRQNDVIELEVQHLRAVWNTMKSLQQDGSPAAQAKADAFLKESIGYDKLDSATPYRPVSQISAGEYVYSELDVLLRVRMHLMKVAPNVRVILPSDLSDNEFWRARKQVIIPFNESESEFVRDGLRNFGTGTDTYVTWLGSTSKAQIFQYRVELAIELYKLGEIEVFDTTALTCQGVPNISDCPKKKFTVTAQDVINEWSNVISTMSLTEKGGKPKRDVHYLNLLGVNSRLDKLSLQKFMLDNNGNPRSLFEAFYEVISADEGPQKEALKYYMTDRAVGVFLFAPEKEFRSILGQTFAPLVNDHFSRMKALEDAIHQRETTDGQSKNILEFGYELRDGKMLSTNVLSRDGKPVYLAREKADYYARRINFDRDTGKAFVNAGAQP